jgi:hypothetical protein
MIHLHTYALNLTDTTSNFHIVAMLVIFNVQIIHEKYVDMFMMDIHPVDHWL